MTQRCMLQPQQNAALSEMDAADLMVGLPAELACEVVGEWLHLNEVVRLDSAYASKRHILHKNVFRSPFCILKYSSNVSEEAAMWVCSMFVRVESLFFSAEHFDFRACAEYLKKCGSTVKSICIDSNSELDGSQELLNLIIMHCADLNYLAVGGPSDDDEIFLQPDHSNRAFPVSVRQDLDRGPVTVQQLRTMCSPEAVVMLRTFWIHPYYLHQHTRLRSYSFPITSCMRVDAFYGDVAKAPWIINLEIQNSEALCDEYILTIVHGLLEIHSLNIEGDGRGAARDQHQPLRVAQEPVRVRLRADDR